MNRMSQPAEVVGSIVHTWEICGCKAEKLERLGGTGCRLVWEVCIMKLEDLKGLE